MYLTYATIDMLAGLGDPMAKTIMKRLRAAPGFTPMTRGAMLYIVSGSTMEMAK
jgi:hypothetical protein